jgi:hypothetical protein
LSITLLHLIIIEGFEFTLYNRSPAIASALTEALCMVKISGTRMTGFTSSFLLQAMMNKSKKA